MNTYKSNEDRIRDIEGIEERIHYNSVEPRNGSSWKDEPLTPEIKQSDHGSNTLDEMRARMRDAGYDEWEINEEIDEKMQSVDGVKLNTHLHNELGCFYQSGRSSGTEKVSNLVIPAPDTQKKVSSIHDDTLNISSITQTESKRNMNKIR